MKVQFDFFVALALLVGLTNCQCYYPNGDSKEDDVPCSSAPGSPCCPEGWQCLSNGLCYLDYANYFGRYTCTDKSWKSSGCPNFCTHSNTATGNEAILRCSAGNYCCDANRPDVGCCDTGAPQFHLNDANVGSSSPGGSSSKSAPGSSSSSAVPSSSSPPAPPSSSPTPSAAAPTISSASAAAASSNNAQSSASPSVSFVTTVVTSIISGNTVTSSQTTAVPIAQSSTPSPPSSSNNLGAIIGPAVGVPVALIALAALAFCLWRRRRNNRRSMPRSMTPPVEEPKHMYGTPELDSPQSTPKMARFSGNTLVQSPRFSEFGAPPELAGNYPKYYDPNRPQAGELPGSTYHPYNPHLPRELPG